MPCRAEDLHWFVTTLPVTRRAILVSNDQDAHAVFRWLVDHSVRKDPERIDPLRKIKGCAKSWVLGQKLCDTLKLIQEFTGGSQVNRKLTAS